MEMSLRLASSSTSNPICLFIPVKKLNSPIRNQRIPKSTKPFCVRSSMSLSRPRQTLSSNWDVSSFSVDSVAQSPSRLPCFEELDTTNMLLRQRIVFLGSQCKNGHLACSLCCGKLNNRCSFCECHIGDIRCIAMEKVIEASIVPCPNTKYGCDKTTTYSDQSSHDQKTCYFVPCSCPLPKCNYVGSYTNLKKHVSSAHSWDKHELIPLEFDSVKSFMMDFGKNKMVVFKEEEEGHLFVVQAFKGSQGVYVTVNQIAPMTPGIRNFSCSLVKLGDFSTLRIGLNVQKIQKVRDQMHPEDDVMWIPPKMLRGGQHWMMEICIGNQYKYVRI